MWEFVCFVHLLSFVQETFISNSLLCALLRHFLLAMMALLATHRPNGNSQDLAFPRRAAASSICICKEPARIIILSFSSQSHSYAFILRLSVFATCNSLHHSSLSLDLYCACFKIFSLNDDKELIQ